MKADSRCWGADFTMPLSILGLNREQKVWYKNKKLFFEPLAKVSEKNAEKSFQGEPERIG
jgi:hypothetical protein